jgi:nitrate/TMAO reductase-like tetraheme cytochrome c subunit
MKSNRTIIAMLLILSGSALVGCKSLLQSSYRSAQIPTIPGAVYSGTDSCIPCHDDIYRQYKKTIHYRLAPAEFKWAERGCETCHGPGSLHVKSKGAIQDILGFSRLTPQESSEICLQCHTGAPTMDWRANVHVQNGVGCNECHKSHKVTAAKMVYLGDPAI